MKYVPLGDYLERLDVDEKVFTLDQIAHILGDRLPPTASKKRKFWINNSQGHAQARDGWMSVGWRVKRLKIQGKTITSVTFARAPTRAEPGVGMQVIKLTPELRAELMRVPVHSIHAFRDAADIRLGDEFAQVLSPGVVAGVEHKFDLVSPNKQIVGECRLYTTPVKDNIHSATYASISEAVFLLQHVKAATRFIVFGGQKRVPLAWLQRHGALAHGVAFHFLHTDGRIELLQDAHLVRDVAGAQ